jgi:glucose-6-phosphate 1-dehydrogenase
MNLAPPAVVVIFGASGDLTRRKLVPALHSLSCGGLLSPHTYILGVARSPLDEEAFRDQLFGGISEYSRLKPDVCALWGNLAPRVHYLQGEYDDAETYRRIGGLLDGWKTTDQPMNCLFYLATPPELYPLITARLGEASLNHPAQGWARIIIEKPFGHDLPSAIALNQQVHSIFHEDQIYRIDHYLGKETVQNILTLRFANLIFEPLWNNHYIDHVQITVAEDVGVGHRAGFYEKAGVLRDMFQNHLLQLLMLTAMEPPAVFEADALRDEKVKVLRAIRQDAKGVRAQYEGYRSEAGVDAQSQTPTFAALEFFVDNWRWQGVPFYLRSGKQMAEKHTSITVQFKQVIHQLFPLPPGGEINPNLLCLFIQPDEGIRLGFEAKEPGTGMHSCPVNMDFSYAGHFGASALPEAYERLLLDALQGDASLFSRADEVELAWKVMDPILRAWEGADAPPLFFYPPGSWGPPEADQMLAGDGRKWQS